MRRNQTHIPFKMMAFMLKQRKAYSTAIYKAIECSPSQGNRLLKKMVDHDILKVTKKRNSFMYEVNV